MFGSTISDTLKTKPANQQIQLVLNAVKYLANITNTVVSNGQENFDIVTATDLAKRDQNSREMTEALLTLNNEADLRLNFPTQMNAIEEALGVIGNNVQTLNTWEPVKQAVNPQLSLGRFDPRVSMSGYTGMKMPGQGSTMRNVLVIGGIAVVGWVIYKKYVG